MGVCSPYKWNGREWKSHLWASLWNEYDRRKPWQAGVCSLGWGLLATLFRLPGQGKGPRPSHSAGACMSLSNGHTVRVQTLLLQRHSPQYSISGHLQQLESLLYTEPTAITLKGSSCLTPYHSNCTTHRATESKSNLFQRSAHLELNP